MTFIRTFSMDDTTVKLLKRIANKKNTTLSASLKNSIECYAEKIGIKNGKNI